MTVFSLACRKVGDGMEELAAAFEEAAAATASSTS